MVGWKHVQAILPCRLFLNPNHACLKFQLIQIEKGNKTFRVRTRVENLFVIVGSDGEEARVPWVKMTRHPCIWSIYLILALAIDNRFSTQLSPVRQHSSKENSDFALGESTGVQMLFNFHVLFFNYALNQLNPLSFQLWRSCSSRVSFSLLTRPQSSRNSPEFHFRRLQSSNFSRKDNAMPLTRVLCLWLSGDPLPLSTIQNN